MDEGKGLFGIYIHNLKCPRAGTCSSGANPFDGFNLKESGRRLSNVVPCYSPNSESAYTDIKSNFASWVERAISSRKA
jgi:hypothetical protein